MLSAKMAKMIAQARPTGGGIVITDGIYVLEIVRMIIDAKFSGTCFIVELIVVTSTPNFTDEKGNVVAPNKAGTTCSYVVNLDKNLNAAGNCKAFVLALLGLKEDELTYDDDKFNEGGLPGDNGKMLPDRWVQVQKGAPMSDDHRMIDIMKTVADLVGEDQPARGMLIGDTTFRKEIKGIQNPANKGKPFTGHNWQTIEQTDDEIAARRKLQDNPTKAAA